MGDYPVWVRIVVLSFFSVLALLPFFVCSKKKGFFWLISFVWGALSFSSVFLFQMPVQKFIGDLLMGSDVPANARMFLLILPSGIIQEFFKWLLPAVLILIFSKSVGSNRLLGPLSGAGFGITEAILLVGLAHAPIGLIAILERFSAMLFHIGATSIAVGNGNLKRAIWAVPLMMATHSVWNYASVSLSKKINIVSLEIFILIVGFAVWFIAVFTFYRGVQSEK